MTKDELFNKFSVFALGTPGIGNWLQKGSNTEIHDRLLKIENDPLPLKKAQLNQLLVLGHEAPVSDGFFEFYWCSAPENHIYKIDSITLPDDLSIKSIKQFKWGLERLFIDSIFCWGNVRTGFRELRNLSLQEIKDLFSRKKFDTEMFTERGPCLPLEKIAKDNRHLISEVARKNYDVGGGEVELEQRLLGAYKNYRRSGNTGSPTIKRLFKDKFLDSEDKERQGEFKFLTENVFERLIESEEEISEWIKSVLKKFQTARKAALKNTKRYLSMVSDLDVYIATSMRTQKDFRYMVDQTKEIFRNKDLLELNLRYFDPTLSAAESHEDKGLIECLMVKCAKVLVYFAGDRDSFGKDAEAAMALSLGKPVIFFTKHAQKTCFYKNVHPLSRLIHFDTGVAVGAIITDQLNHIPELLNRIFNNKMEYHLEKDKYNYLRLEEKLTGSIVRLQTNDQMLNETFWNHYHAK